MALGLVLATSPVNAAPIDRSPLDPATAANPDLARHRGDPVWARLSVATLRFAEGDYSWTLIVITDPARPAGPFWFVPHDDEDAAFDAGFQGLTTYGGRLVAVANGGRRALSAAHGGGAGCVHPCDPNRDFGPRGPLYSATVLGLMAPGQPAVGLHTNAPGSVGHGGRGSIFADPADVARIFASPTAAGAFANGDTMAIVAGRAPKALAHPPCVDTLNAGGVHVAYEQVSGPPDASGDGSLSNHLALEDRDPPRTYVGLEARHGDAASEIAMIDLLMTCPAFAASR
ncbi:hypothetical protein [Phenylobacterium aquaticum]|uniref:hypothetical protein n=1 Tax=Phenylobacterium aquaticum TaxID=1763816 RepID=UPI0026ECFF99|nr:hypothetical protein [Phenylobacterium aquaticum]